MITESKPSAIAIAQSLDLSTTGTIHYQKSPEELAQDTLSAEMGTVSDSGAINVRTGAFTGRSPKDRFIVQDAITRDTVDWNAINKPIDPKYYTILRDKIINYLSTRDIYIRDAYACADPSYRLTIRVATEYPWSNLFAYNMFLRPREEELHQWNPEWTILCAPGMEADPDTDGVIASNFAIINFTEQCILIGGTGYTGEIKKGIFSVLNYVLPQQRGVLSMHCSSNVGAQGDTAIFFGLSGTGKTTLSADPERKLIGDDEHGWSDEGVFNFEGGCYAKTINLTAEQEPEIFGAIRPGAILENVIYHPGTNEPDYTDASITQNTRVSYPIHHIANRQDPSRGGHPKHIFFLTADAFGVLPPISRLTRGQAMYQFISGYTAKVAGTEEGVNEPKATFSACFGAPFLPLHPTQYAEMLGDQMDHHQTTVWLVNTGWTGGPYGVGSRIKLRYTRAMIRAAMRGDLESVAYVEHPIFGLRYPTSCPDVPSEVLDARASWSDAAAYDDKAHVLANYFVDNFQAFADKASDEILAAAPRT